MTRIKSILRKAISFLKNYISKRNLYYVVETADWVVKEHGISILKNLDKSISSSISFTGYGIKNSVIHFGTEGVFFNNKVIKEPHKSNKVIVTWFHIKEDDPKLAKINEADKYIDLWQTSCNITKNKLIKYGIDDSKIRLIPIGVDLDIYKPLKTKQIVDNRKKLNIPKDSIVIGSFQKDGNGWGEGLEPKMEKGPDLFCDVVERLSKKYKVFVLLTGPARGYVKNRLLKAGIEFHHKFLENPNDVVDYFQLCDLYIVASREEGGPKAILESMACGVPIVSTKVGMAPDVIENGKDGFLTDIDDVDDLYEKSELIIDAKVDRKSLIESGLEKVKQYDYKKLSASYQEMYEELV